MEERFADDRSAESIEHRPHEGTGDNWKDGEVQGDKFMGVKNFNFNL
jgi:hypothetical protein